MDAALNIVRQSSLEELTTGGIGNAMGVSQPAIYHHFRSRDQLVVEVMNVICNQIADRIAPHANLPWTEAVRKFVSVYSEEFQVYTGVANHLQTFGAYVEGARRIAQIWMELFKGLGLPDDRAGIYTFHLNQYVLGFFSWYDTGAEVGPHRYDYSPLRDLREEDYADTPLALTLDQLLRTVDPMLRLDHGLAIILAGIGQEL
ncbi:TetR/AcrR family transcriptional regulator [Parasphingopyxis algicola]|uniref:TetR/AcrR family transcriptional regulator n=1 Tax=Parasphingopyxis algicola TaxID=2026624 RepID=UPI0015A3B117|nr:TetR/AcrR family transcriptional regulator [Parasphingopyxis algicola]QLC23922.1 TetR/AcrR family transcriptional regulator [Parasphingopyxis algicola]